MQFLGIKALQPVLQEQFDYSDITREHEDWRAIKWEAVFYRKWIMMQARKKMYLFPMVYCIKWAAGDRKGQHASFTKLRPGFLPRSKLKISSSWGLPGPLTWQSEGRRSHSAFLLPPPTTLISVLQLLASSAETLIFLSTFCQDHTYYPVHTVSLFDCVSSLWEAGTHDRSCARTTSLGSRSDRDGWEQSTQRKEY